jgi:hypothetical protein
MTLTPRARSSLRRNLRSLHGLNIARSVRKIAHGAPSTTAISELRRRAKGDVRGTGDAAAVEPPSAQCTAGLTRRECDLRISAYLGLLTIRDRDDASVLDAASADGASDADSST